MSLGPTPVQGDFASTFPGRFASAMDQARGVIAGLHSGLGREGVAEDALARLHEIYRLRVELELETAGVLWRTAEVVCALSDAMTVLAERDRGPGGGARALLEAEGRRRMAGITSTGPLARRPGLTSVSRPGAFAGPHANGASNGSGDRAAVPAPHDPYAAYPRAA